MPIKPILFDFYPDLRGKLGWLDLGLSVAPVRRLSNLGFDNLWIKRNDLISPFIGGNKIRRLEFILADVQRQGKKHIVTLGGIGSNHCLATAMLCRRMGMRCTLCLFEQPVTRYVKETLLQYSKHGARIVFSKGVIGAAFQYYLIQKCMHPEAYFLESGGSSIIGILGAVNAALELSQQVVNGEMPEPAFVFYPTASNGGMAGLSLGFLLSGLKTRVLGVRTGRSRIGPLAINTPGLVYKLIRKTYDFLKEKEGKIPPMNVLTPTLIEDYCGEGYGCPTPEGLSALDIFKTRENVNLEPVYTAKACAALLDFMRKPENKEKTVLYWHTYHSLDFSGEMAEMDYHNLPKGLHRFFEE